MEKKVASRRLYVVSVICLIFMVGEIVGESRCCFSQSFYSFILSPLVCLFLTISYSGTLHYCSSANLMHLQSFDT